MTEADESLVSMERAARRLVERLLADEGEESDDPSSSGQQALFACRKRSHEADPPALHDADPPALRHKPPCKVPHSRRTNHKQKCEAARKQMEIMLQVLSIEQLRGTLIAGIGYVQWPLPRGLLHPWV